MAAILISVFVFPSVGKYATQEATIEKNSLTDKDNDGLIIFANSSGPNYTIHKIKSGLETYDQLKDGNLSRISVDKIKSTVTHGWLYYGSAFGVNAPVSVHEDSQKGLVIGAAAAREGDWVSHYAMSPDTYATVFHTVMTNPYTSLSNDSEFQVGMYVQTTISNGLVNYVSCGAYSSPSGVVWQVVYASANFSQANNYQTLWRDTSIGQPITRDCKLLTNGNNYLEVYIDNVRVYSNNTLRLQMPQPFNSYLEVTTPSSDRIRYALFEDYYAAYGKTVKVINAPAGGRVKIIGESNKVLADALVQNDGTSNLNIIQYPFPLISKIQIYDAGNKTVTSISNP